MKIATVKTLKLYFSIVSYLLSLFTILCVAIDDLFSIFVFAIIISVSQILIIGLTIKEKHKTKNNVVLLKKEVG